MAAAEDPRIQQIIESITNGLKLNHGQRDIIGMRTREVFGDLGGFMNNEQLIENIKDVPDIKDILRSLVPYKCYMHPQLVQRFNQNQVSDDGNCLFHSLGLALRKDHREVRREICQWLRETKDVFSQFDTSRYFLNFIDDEYIRLMANEAMGDNIIICAAMLCYNCPIDLYNMNGEKEIEIETFKSDVNSHSRELLNNRLIVLYICSSSSQNHPQHFELLTPKENTDNDAALAAALAAEKKYLKYKQKYLLLKKKLQK